MYASLVHVEALAPARAPFTASSIPDAAQVAIFLEQAEGEVNGILAGDGYQVPVPTGATISLPLLQRYTALGAWAQVEESAQTSTDVERAVKAWELARQELTKGTVQLADAPRLGGENFARAMPYASPFFSRCMET